MSKYIFLCTVFMFNQASADEVQIAVAANFSAPVLEISKLFNKSTGHQLKITTGASGKFYAQIKNGAPFQVFLSADEEKPIQLEKDGLAVPGTRFTYALGKLVLWSADPHMIDPNGKVLEINKFSKIAIANPKLAPYGQAALEVLTSLSLKNFLEPKFVMGENISQTYQFIASGNAELGFIALSQVIKNNQITSGSAWLVPESFYSPIKQDAVLLIPGKNSTAALQLLKFLKSDAALNVIKAYGYNIN